MPVEPPSRAELTETLWDVVIVGTGMGGATLGYALAKAGHRILFVEKGRSFLNPADDSIRGLTPEEVYDLGRLGESERNQVLARGCRSFDNVTDQGIAKTKQFVPEIGNGGGGSTALFGMVLERMFPADFTPRQNHPDADESTLPEQWPISYEELSPHYAAAERLFRVRGTPDPLRPNDEGQTLIAPPPLTQANAQLFGFLEEHGLHPYQLHLACEHLDDCQTCQGFLCARGCKNDAGKICLAPAVHQHGARIVDECAALRFEGRRNAVERLICQRHGETLELRGKVFVLAAGGLVTPVLMLNSKSEYWPSGLANEHDQVGRNLMRHCIDMTVLWPKKLTEPIHGQTKELSFNDFYLRDGNKYGSVQSIGGLPPFLHYLGKLGPELRFFRYLRPILGRLWDWQRKQVVVLASILEDPSYHDNRVLPGDETTADGSQSMTLQYRLRDRERDRAAAYRQEVKTLFKPFGAFCLGLATENKVVAHVCGTCRFGDDPRNSVLDRNCRAHELDNLYIADASFFASSGGINPSLTIAANALRVAEHLHTRL